MGKNCGGGVEGERGEGGVVVGGEGIEGQHSLGSRKKES